MKVEDKKQLKEALDKGLQYLTDMEKYALFLTYYEDLSLQEILLVLEITDVDYVKYITNAKTKMRSFTSIFDELDKKFGMAYVPGLTN